MTQRFFAYNTGTTIAGTLQLGNLAIGTGTTYDWRLRPGGLTWWGGPDEDNGFIVARPVAAQNWSTPIGNIGPVNFYRSSGKTEAAFINLVNNISGQNLTDAVSAMTWCKNQNYYHTFSYNLGAVALGGQIAYIYKSGDPGYDPFVQHGLVMQSATTYSADGWGCENTLISGASGTSIGTGYQNSLDIMAGCASLNTAARMCRNSTVGGYTDWFLPSHLECKAIHPARNLITGLAFNVVWTSTQNSALRAYEWRYTIVSDAQGYTYDKSYINNVRAVRYF